MKFFIGNEYTGMLYDRVKWIIETFSEDSYKFVDVGYFHYERYVVFNEEKDALFYQLRWS